MAPGPGGDDPDHWLYRLTAPRWLAAADTELGHCHDTLARRAVRPGVTHARRAAGMALNAVLVQQERPHWGRSYMEHVTALAGDAEVPAEVRAHAAFLRDTQPAPPALVTLGRPDLRPAESARAIADWAKLSVER
jgi:hypothetical protein